MEVHIVVYIDGGTLYNIACFDNYGAAERCYKEWIVDASDTADVFIQTLEVLDNWG